MKKGETKSAVTEEDTQATPQADQDENAAAENDAAGAMKASGEQKAKTRKKDGPRKKRLSRLERVEQEKNELAGERDVLADRLLRLQADFENFRKRMLREKDDLYRRANEDLLLELLPVLDHMDLAMEAAASHDVPPAFVEGFQLVSEQFLSTLKKFGLSLVDDAGTFDPSYHEAVSHLPSPEVPADHIMARVRKGYMLGERLLRPAQVVVSSGPLADAQDEARDGE